MAIKELKDFVKKKARSFRHYVRERKLGSASEQREVIDRFHQLYYDSEKFGKTWSDTRWLGVKVDKCPFDLWVYQELIFELRPDVVVETGTLYGGSAYYMATMLDLVDHGRVLTIDILEQPNRPRHDRIEYFTASSTAGAALAKVESAVEGAGTVLVILDSDHHRDHVLDELRKYHRFVTPGSYLIVEDSNVNGHPVKADHGPGPMEAIDAFLAETRAFAVDPAREKFLMTFNPRGYLKRNR